MVIEKESERPALKLRDKNETCERFWTIYCPAYGEYGNGGEWWTNIENAQRFKTFDDAKSALKEYGYLARVAFVEIEVKVHFNNEDDR